MRERSVATVATFARTNGDLSLRRPLLELAALLLAVIALLAPATVFAQGGPLCPPSQTSGNNQSGQAGSTLAQPMIVTQTFSSGAQPPPEPFNWVITSGNATFLANGGTTLTSNSPYVAITAGVWEAQNAQRIVFGNDPGGTVTIEVESQSCGGARGPIVFTQFIDFPPPTFEVIKLAGDGVTGGAGQFVTVRARLTDTCQSSGSLAQRGLGGCPVNVRFTIETGDAAFASGGTTFDTVTDANEQVSAQIRLGSTPGEVRVSLDPAPTVYPTAVFALAVGAPRTLSAIGGNNQSGPPNSAGVPLEALLLENGQPVAGETIQWTRITGGSAQLASGSTQTGSDGVARNALTFTDTFGTTVFEARTARGEAVRFTVTNTAGGLFVVSGDGQTGPLGGEPDQPIVFELRNANGSPAVSQPISFSVISGSATLTPLVANTDSNGRASVRVRFGTSAGDVVVQASANGGQSTATARVTAFTPQLTIASGNNQTAPAGTRLPLPLVVQLSPPAAPKGLGGVVVSWTVLSGGGTLASATGTTNASGQASNELTLGPQPGVNQVQATVAGVGSVVFTATGTGATGGATQITIVSGNNQIVPTFESTAPLVVRVSNAQGAPVPGATIDWRGNPAGAVVVTPASSTTNASGEASTVAQVQLPGDQQVIATLAGASPQPSVTFTLNGGVVNVAGLTEGQAEVAGAIDAACPALFVQSQSGPLDSGAQDLLNRCSELVVNAGNNPDDVIEALDQMLADEASAQSTAAITIAATQFDNLKARIAALRSGSRGASLGGLSLVGDGGALPLSFLPSAILAAEDAAGGGEAGAEFSRWGFFATGTIGRGEQDDREESPGFDFSTQGLTAGVDYRFSDSLVFGGAVGWSSNTTDVDADQGELDTRGYSLSGYATWYRNSWYTDAVLTWGRNSYDLQRRIRYELGGTTVDQLARASPDGAQTAFSLSVGRDFARGAWNLGPYARASYTRIEFDPYTERMSNPGAPGSGLAVSVEGRDLKSLEGVLGGRASYTMSTSWGVLMPHVQLEWLHEFEDSTDSLVSRFVNDPTRTAIVIPGEEVDSNYFNVGLGLSGVFANGRSAFLYYEHRAGQQDFSQDSLAIGVRIEF